MIHGTFAFYGHHSVLTMYDASIVGSELVVLDVWTPCNAGSDNCVKLWMRDH